MRSEATENLPEVAEYGNPTRAMINLAAFRHNLDHVRRLAPGALIVLPVKANAYGHGDLLIARAAADAGVDYLAVARVNEGLKLRRGGVELPIVVLGVEYGPNIRLALENDLELSVGLPGILDEIEAEARLMAVPSRVHLKVDTGMTRLGCQPPQAVELATRIHRSRHMVFGSLYTHFAMSDSSEEVTAGQADAFLRIRSALERNGTTPEFYHLSNSGGVLGEAGHCRGEIPGGKYAVRPGMMCYGYVPDGHPSPDLHAVMTLVTKVVHVMDVPRGTGIGYGHAYTTPEPARLAVIPLGYGDGLFRSLSEKLVFRINGRDYPQRGRISMDLTVVEVDDRVALDDDVFVFGDPALCALDADDLAREAGTISYEITTAVAERIERIPVEDW